MPGVLFGAVVGDVRYTIETVTFVDAARAKEGMDLVKRREIFD